MLDGHRAPFPWFGGKSRVASLVWERFGDPQNYCEPFAGSLAVLLARPSWAEGESRVETVNDLDCYLANFWRAATEAPEDVAHFADWPVNEADLHARHRWLVGLAEFRERLRRDPEYFDPKVAGWWVWGLCTWIGSGWCDIARAESGRDEGTRAQLAGGEGHHGNGVHAAGMRVPGKLPLLGGTKGTGVHRPSLKLPRVGSGGGDSGPEHGVGVHGVGMREPAIQLPMLSGTTSRPDGCAQHGTGIHGVAIRSTLYETFERLAARLRYVRVACGDWARICTDSVTWRHGTTAVLLDPPYSDGVRSKGLYAVDSGEVAAEVLRWAREHGDDKRLRIALCGYETEGHGAALPGWSVVAWKAKGGYGGQRKTGKNENAALERVWFSPGCLAPERPAQAQLALDLGR